MVDASGFFKTAASYIRQGVDAKYREVAELRRAIDNKQGETKKQIDQLKQSINDLHGDIASSHENQNDPDKDRTDKLKEVSRLRGLIVEKEHNFEKERDQMLSRIKALEADLSGLAQHAKSLESKG